jgi:hypothetical protein
VSSDWFTFGINNSDALMSGSGVATEGASSSAGLFLRVLVHPDFLGNSAVTAVDAPTDSEQSILPAAGGDGNSLTLTASSGWFFRVPFNFYTIVVSAEVVAAVVAAAGLPPGTKLYALILKISSCEISYHVRN